MSPGAGGDLLVTNASEVATLAGGPRTGDDLGELDLVEGAAVAVRDGEVVEVGPTREVEAAWADELGAVLDAGGRAVVPGFVDGHTHPVFAGDRSHELAWKLRGLSYREIADRGGGIRSTVEATRAAPPDDLLEGLLERLDVVLAHGTTTLEAKSGYGLDLATERKLLEVLRDADAAHPVDLVPTLMAAHDLPPGLDDVDAYVDEVVERITPELADLAEFADVFCEDGWFPVDASRRVLEAGLAHGLAPKVHADELARSGGSRLAAEVGAVSADHLLEIQREDAEALADAEVAAVLCPATALSLDADYADARLLRDAGAVVALGTDLNPNNWCPSMGFALQLACHGMRLTPAEALAAATVNAATSCGREDEVGSLEAGKRGDLLVLDAPTHVHLAYRLGTNPVRTVVKDGRVVHGPGPDGSAGGTPEGDA